ncbi:Pyrroline-5-carboxylate reductase (EC 1.5.1.2) [uncultured Gammaproteobacteria bacterium]|jgi:pyrroline-5-carboxylate reductase|uniref:pyrroline-5-carboxylate reductase n=1 Tax=thiotrophic endosymbiont of Bathymodiolus puteoserpentis (Logatchev) TaxID=343240 RepID=UPI0010BB4502|nr:pyrroline-5-carboxylate reductase [thiotrophic endosymbiont of Bathymodiolus puteoserpentis (Logatchev)]CAC9655477.1 Pyrroline-5-carboxylate reductase (EC 1.5.1.2) [uncultured Gammaproteobacteria bacterium]CAC9658011.1 Pyrroline-5-carboxylate reductase (EC 1.5.1.2) [uncultured Gammaproteobacteria bacterium]CAC9989531.1 Pyrroline-5-carboxylate reductase (EC 1.5.1.2) [uncultured Gammaproteobacteria bacterium]SSC09538.1 Pyrroline-5-carboxylate reductase [thiotrophic endosymbiont of Bathymodiolu
MQKTTTIGFIGAGNMAHALISGLINNGFEASNIKLSDTDTTLLSQRKLEFGVEVFTDNSQVATGCDVVVLAVKPQILSSVCKEIKIHTRHRPLMISIAAGVKSRDINAWLGGGASIVRTMPNTPALVGKGATGMVANDAVSDKQKELAEQILGSVGEYFWVKEETMLDAVTALSGSGPAYFFLMIESMTNAGVALGLDKQIAEKLSIQTALGASTMSKQSADSARELRAKVTSKNGTTQAAIESFQEQNFEIIISHAMRAAFERAREIGFELSDNA